MLKYSSHNVYWKLPAKHTPLQSPKPSHHFFQPSLGSLMVLWAVNRVNPPMRCLLWAELVVFALSVVSSSELSFGKLYSAPSSYSLWTLRPAELGLNTPGFSPQSDGRHQRSSRDRFSEKSARDRSRNSNWTAVPVGRAYSSQALLPLPVSLSDLSTMQTQFKPPNLNPFFHALQRLEK